MAAPDGVAARRGGRADTLHEPEEVVMVRTLAAVFAGLFLCAGFVAAQERREERQERREERKEARKPVTGTYESYKNGVLVLKVEGKPVEYQVGPEFKTTVWPETGEVRENVFARESFRDMRVGTPVQITWGEGDKVGGVIIGTPRKRP